MKYSRALAAVAGTVLVAGLAAGCGGGSSDGTASSAGGGGASASGDAGGQKKDLVVGVSNTLAGNGWRETMICSIKAQALASGQVSKVVVVSKNGGPTEQIQDLQNLVSQGVNILIVNPSDPEKLNSIIAEATKQGITVVAVDSSVTAPEAYVVTNDQVAWGKLEMEALAKLIGGKGEVLYMRGIQGVQADTDRDTGVQEVIKAAKSGDWSRADDGAVVVGGHPLEDGEYELVLQTADDVAASPVRYVDPEGRTIDTGLVVALDTNVTPELHAEGVTRDLVRAVQSARKDAGFDVTDRIALTLQLPADQQAMVAANQAHLESSVLATSVSYTDAAQASSCVLDGVEVTFALARA